MSFDTNEFFLKDDAEMAEAFAPWPEAVPTTLEIAERCSTEIELGGMLIPSYATPDGSPEGEYLRRLALAGLHKRYGDPPPAEAIERLDMELEVIGRMGFDAYFLIVWDFIKYAKDNNIAVGPGRGSAAGSIVSYCLNITEVDPLAYGLLFERFLNPERVSMPDIDIDFSVKGRAQVMRYVSDKYGKESVAQIVTFGKMLPRNATRDAARVLGKDYAIGDRLGEAHPRTGDGPLAHVRAVPQGRAGVQARVRPEPDAREVIDTAMGLEGIVRNAGHPRRRGGDRRPAADRHRAPAADGGQGRGQRGRGQGLPHGHPVLDEADRGDRPPQDGLPRPAQPRRHRGLPEHHRAVDGRGPARHGDAAARRRRRPTR